MLPFSSPAVTHAVVIVRPTSTFFLFSCLARRAKADRKCKEMATGVSSGAASTDDLVAAAASALENALVEQKGAINTWSEEVRRTCYKEAG